MQKKTAIDRLPPQSELHRRGFMKGLLAAGLVSSLPCSSLLVPRRAQASPFEASEYEVRINACPVNCNDTCTIKTHLKDGVVQFVEGAKEHTFTDGALCVKGYSYPRRLYSPDRVKYPMIQDGRGTGKWRRISWEEAMDRIAKKLLEIKEKDGSLLGFALTKYSGNFGITNYGVEGMMTSLGPTTRFVSNACDPAGKDAMYYNMGLVWSNDVEDLVDAKYIIIWGGNPAYNSMHSMKLVYEAKKRGAKVLVIDPVLTQTAAKADTYWKVRPGTDGALALGMARHLLDSGLVDQDFVQSHAKGFEDFADYLRREVTVEWASGICGIPAEEIRRVSAEFASISPATLWLGVGMQRNSNGGAMVRAIGAFAAMAGIIGKEGGGMRFTHGETWGFNYHAMLQEMPKDAKGVPVQSEPDGPVTYTNRLLNANKIAQEIFDTQDPPVRMLWSSCKNPFAQDFDRNKLQKAFEKLEMVVSVEQFFTETVKYSDIVLPVTTLFEEWNVNVSYWHYWISINEQSVKPLYETKSNIEIAAALSKAINKLAPDSCTFAQEVDGREWTAKEFNKGIYEMFGLKNWEELLSGPRKAQLKTSAAWPDKTFKTPSGKFEFWSDLAKEHGFSALPTYVPLLEGKLPFQLLTPHTYFGLHSQFINLDWMQCFYPEPFVYIHPKAAAAKGIQDKSRVRVFNDRGEVFVRVKLTDNVRPECVLMYEAWFRDLDFNVQNLVGDTSTDMGAMTMAKPGAAVHTHYVDFERA